MKNIILLVLTVLISTSNFALASGQDVINDIKTALPVDLDAYLFNQMPSKAYTLTELKEAQAIFSKSQDPILVKMIETSPDPKSTRSSIETLLYSAIRRETVFGDDRPYRTTHCLILSGVHAPGVENLWKGEKLEQTKLLGQECKVFGSLDKLKAYVDDVKHTLPPEQHQFFINVVSHGGFGGSLSCDEGDEDGGKVIDTLLDIAKTHHVGFHSGSCYSGDLIARLVDTQKHAYDKQLASKSAFKQLCVSTSSVQGKVSKARDGWYIRELEKFYSYTAKRLTLEQLYVAESHITGLISSASYQQTEKHPYEGESFCGAPAAQVLTSEVIGGAASLLNIVHNRIYQDESGQFRKKTKGFSSAGELGAKVAAIDSIMSLGSDELDEKELDRRNACRTFVFRLPREIESGQHKMLIRRLRAGIN